MMSAKDEAALCAARRELERIGRELEESSQVVSGRQESGGRDAVLSKAIAVKDSSRAESSSCRIFSSDSEGSDLDAELGMELDQVLGGEDLIELLDEESPVERILESLDCGDRSRVVDALSWVRAEPPESLKRHASCLEGPLAKLRQSSDRVVAQAARSARLRLFAATKSDEAAPNANELTHRDLEAQERKLRRTFHEATQAWHKEKAQLKEEIERARQKTQEALDSARKTAQAARADNVRFQREISALKLKLREAAKNTKTEESSPSTTSESSAFLRLRRSPSTQPQSSKRPKSPRDSDDAHHERRRKLPACKRMVKPRTSDVSPNTTTTSSPPPAAVTG